MSENARCENCEWWKDYSDRVFARVSGGKGDLAGNVMELRKCRYATPPTMGDSRVIYTDKDHVCSAHQRTT